MLVPNLLVVARNVMKDPGIIVGPISWILGQVINIFFTIIYKLGIHANALGISIILLTIFTRLLMTPIAYKQQKSMFKMQALAPELKKIQEKYKGSQTDPEIARKLQMETAKLYQENDCSPFSGCLPMFIQLPIFFGLYHVMQNPFKYIDIINQIYTAFSTEVLTAAGTSEAVRSLVLHFGELCKIPDGTQIVPAVFNRIINVLEPADIKQLLAAVNSPQLTDIYNQKVSMEYFLGLNLTETVGLSLSPKLIIPILSGGTTYLSSWLISRKNPTTDPAMKTQQRIMNITMPLMMAWITLSLPGGIGIYWITSNIFMVLQQVILNRHFSKSGALDIVVPKTKKGGKR